MVDRSSTNIIINENQSWAKSQLAILFEGFANELLPIATGFKLPLKSVFGPMQD
ncbi:hypothetical protein QUB50_24915 [Microcoleus sp. A6-C5]